MSTPTLTSIADETPPVQGVTTFKDPLGLTDQQTDPLAFTKLPSSYVPGQPADTHPGVTNPSDVPGTAGPDSPQATGFTPTGKGDDVGNAIVAEAMKYVGVKYVYGGNGPSQFDCSGLTRWAYGHAAGIELPRISYQQANQGTRIAFKDMRPGDLVAWDDSSRNPGADHIAIYVGDGKIIEAPRPGKTVRVRSLGEWSQDKYAWGVRMKGVNGGA